MTSRLLKKAPNLHSLCQFAEIRETSSIFPTCYESGFGEAVVFQQPASAVLGYKWAKIMIGSIQGFAWLPDQILVVPTKPPQKLVRPGFVALFMGQHA